METEKAKHTPGPWTCPGIGVKDTQISPIGWISWGRNILQEEKRANAALIAAAPEMLAAIREYLRTYCGAEYEGVRQLRAAIAKATGK